MDVAVVHEEDARAHVVGKLHLVGDNEHGHAFVGQLTDDAEHFAHHCGVEGRRGFVEEDDLGLHGQSAGDGHTLFLTARETRWIDIGFLCQSYFTKERQTFLTCLLRIFMEQLARGQHHIFEHGLVREEVERLEHHTHLLAHQMDGITFSEDILSIDDDTASGGLFQQIQAAEQSALACTRGTDDGDDLAAMDVGIDVFQHIERPVAFLQVGNGDEESVGIA